MPYVNTHKQQRTSKRTMDQRRRAIAQGVMLIAAMQQQIRIISEQVENENDPAELRVYEELITGYLNTIRYMRLIIEAMPQYRIDLARDL